MVILEYDVYMEYLNKQQSDLCGDSSGDEGVNYEEELEADAD